MTLTSITNVRIFDGDTVLPARTITLEGPTIHSIGGPAPEGATIIDGNGGTLLPGLIDAHTHTSVDSLRDALRFGVTTELEMMGHWSAEDRAGIADDDSVADVRSAGFGISAPDGHPSELLGGPQADQHSVDQERLGEDPAAGPQHGPHGFVMPSATTPEEAVEFVEQLVATGSDYIKVMIEEGSVLASPGLPMMTNDTVVAAVQAGHKHGKTVVAHALTLKATRQAIDAGVDGLAHLFIDQPHTADIINAIAESGAFVTPCLSLNASIMGGTGQRFADDPRIASKLSPQWDETLRSSFNTFPEGRLEDVLGTVAALHAAGVDILAGTDVSMPVPSLGGLAHGVSLHHELQLVVEAGLTPIQALHAATSATARRFGLGDRGRIRVGARADLILVAGDPTTDITTTLDLRHIWRRGAHTAA
ncbi:imidazolonepropionase [Subtercola boreus]|uniref:Imidazolonepropionase n=1 Tax=Subtercola boreus TaxID=120213 RepID=A0A3E0VRN4_9MICO|nr:amidohydrolase family protein [Subtercola boreus]RFA12108.1 imidazolonepropionase [Subtercola boreus]